MSRKFGSVRQIGYVVRDVEAAMHQWVDRLGIRPWYYFPRVPLTGVRSSGVPISLDLGIALASSGDLQIELVQQRDATPSMYTRFLEICGEGMHHVGYWTTDFPGAFARAKALGHPVIHESGEGSDAEGRAAFFDTGLPGAIIEISGLSEAKGKFFEQVRISAIDWDGSDPIRVVGGEAAPPGAFGGLGRSMGRNVR